MPEFSDIIYRPMKSDEFEKYARLSINLYAEELLESGQSDSRENALKNAESEFNDLLTDGIDTKDNFFAIAVNKSGNDVGVIWYHICNKQLIFICDFLIYEQYRQKNYGWSTLKKLEEFAEENNIGQLKLHVFSYNLPAVNLYRKFGFVVEEEKENGSIYMIKDLHN